MKRKVLSLLLVAAMTATMLTGCGGKDSASDSGSAGDSGNAGTEAPAEGGDLTLTFLDVAPSDTRTTYYESMFQKFYEETGIQVEYQSVPWDDAADKLTVLGAANNLPDVMTTWNGWLGQFTQSGWVIPLDDYIGDTTSDYTDAVVNILFKSEQTRYGHIYTIPDGLMVKGIYVRKDWCEEAGIKLDPTKPWTYDDYFELIEKLTDPEKGRYGASYRGARGALDPLWVYLQGYTGGATFNQEGQILMNNEECLEAFVKWTDIYKNGGAPQDAINWGFTEMVDNYAGGLTGTLINDSEDAATLINSMEDSQWMVMPMPTSEKDGIIYNTINAPYAYSISGNSQNPDASWKLIEFLTSAENQAEYCQLTGEIPIKNEASGLDYYGEDGYYGVFLQQMNDPTLAVPTSFGTFDFTDLHQGLFHEEIQSYLLGDESAADALGNICTALQERMDEYMAENPDAGIETALTMN